jgi:ATP-dependent DNA ligase
MPLIVDGLASLPVETCIIDGEAMVVDQNGLSVFDLLRYRQHDHASPYRAGRTDQWLKMKNPEAPAVRREREVDWAKR